MPLLFSVFLQMDHQLRLSYNFSQKLSSGLSGPGQNHRFAVLVHVFLALIK